VSKPAREAGVAGKTKMELTAETATDFWNDSCNSQELQEAVDQGAVGATSNPVIVAKVIADQEAATWRGVLESLIEQNPADTEDDLAWKMVAELGRKAAAILRPVYERTGGKKGKLSVQINPTLYPDRARMVAHAKILAKIAPNVSIKAPVNEAGILAMEDMTAGGINVTATVSFTVAQAIASAEGIERGLARAEADGIDTSRMTPYVVIMVGRVDDHLRRVLARDRVTIDPGYIEWAGVAVFKKLYGIFRARGFRSTLLAAAYRHHMHWSEFIGGDVIVSMPYKWWTQFNASDIEVRERMDEPVNKRIVDGLYGAFSEFRRAYDEDGMAPAEFLGYGATIHTLNQFIGGYMGLRETVRARMLGGMRHGNGAV